MVRKLGWVWLSLLALYMVSGCCKVPKPATKAAGDSCTGDEALCSDAKNILVCDKGRLAAMDCKGSKGCYKQGDGLYCDFSGNPVGELCPSSYNGQAVCTPDNKTQVACNKNMIVSRLCGGIGGCKDMGAEDICDITITSEGAFCSTVGAAGCSTDGKTILTCKNNMMTKDTVCPGACIVKGTEITCEGNPSVKHTAHGSK